MQFKLSAEEVSLAVRIGKARCYGKNEKIIYNDSGFHSEADRAYPHIIGAKSEVAYSKITGKSIDMSIHEFTGDANDFEGIEIKTSTWRGDDIELKVKVSEYARKFPIGYVLCRCEGDTITFLGCISRERFEKEKYLRKHKFVENYCVRQDSLKKAIPFVDDGKVNFKILV